MRKTSIILFFAFLPFVDFSQSKYELEKKIDYANAVTESNFDLYNSHYSFFNYELNIADKAVINSIDFNKYEQQRTKNEDVIIYIPEIDKTLILFSKNKVKELNSKN